MVGLPKNDHHDHFPRVKSAGLRGARAVGDARLGKPVELEPIHEMTDAIQAIADGIHKLRSGRLNKKAILLLVSHASGIGQRDVERVLDALADLEATYLKPKRATT